MRTRWRRSLQTRVVVTTLVVSGVVVLLVASLVVDQVGRGLLDAKIRSALSESRAGLSQATAELAALAERPNGAEAPVVQAALQQVAQQLSDRGATAQLYDVVLVGSETSASYASPGAGPDDVPGALAAALARTGETSYVVATVPTEGGRDPGVVVGQVLTTAPALGPYRLYHLFPLTAEEQTLSLVRRTIGAAGLLLVGLLVAIAALLARQVVLPVRMAARTAERLAAGRLEERMAVRGEDEIARLGSTFNSMAEALQRQIRQLEDLSRVQRRFVSDVSHELRTPLTTVRMAADVLHEGRSRFDGETARAAELLQAELDRFEGMLVDLLEISRYDAGAASLDLEEVDVVALAERAVATARPLADRRSTRIDLVAAGSAVAQVDQFRVERVLRNLVVNAVEHGEGRPVEVRVLADDHAVAVRVRDRGVGLRPGEAGLVFTRFWRGDPSRARATGGTGLGLSIALEDVRLHGGWLQAWGEPGRGAVFRLVLPRVAGATVERSPLPLEPDDRSQVPA